MHISLANSTYTSSFFELDGVKLFYDGYEVDCDGIFKTASMYTVRK